MRVILVRGPSGCGKSTWVEHQYPEATVLSADHFFLREFNPRGSGQNVPIGRYSILEKNGKMYEYRFNPTQLGEAHAFCLGVFLQELKRGRCLTLIVDNTFIHKWEYGNYQLSAELAGYDVEIFEFRVETTEQLNLIRHRNCHRVPHEIVAKMCYEFEPDANATVIPLNWDMTEGTKMT